MSSLIISVSGLRGVIGQSLTPKVATGYVAAYASELKRLTATTRPLVIVGRDGRDSGRMLKSAVIASLQASGCDCLDADVIATPTIGVLVRDRGAAGAIQITASHNPPPYNGMKLFADSGRVLDADAGARIRDAYLAGQTAWVDHQQLGRVSVDPDPHAAHCQAVLATVDVAAIRSKRFRVLLDSNHGAGGVLGKRLLEELGCEVVLVGGQPDGQFAHVPEPTSDNLQAIAQRVRQERAEVGFCQDPDADRLALIDADGRYVGEEYTLALCVQQALADPATRGPIVINGATSSMSERLAAAAGVPAHRSAVGEANVVDRMLDSGASYGGEGNGGPIDPRVGLVRDSFVGMAQVLGLMASRGQSLAELCDGLPRLAIHKSKATIDAARLPAALAAVAAAHSDAQADHSDGLRLAWPDRWLLVRGSNTEPIVRLIAEAADERQAAAMVAAAEAIISGSA